MVLATAANARAMSAVIGGLAVDGKLIVVGASPEAIEVSPLVLISARRSIQGWPSGNPADSEDALNFALREIGDSKNSAGTSQHSSREMQVHGPPHAGLGAQPA